MKTALTKQALVAKPKPQSNSACAGLLLQRKYTCESPASLIGECAEFKSMKRLQPKLTVGASNDPLEQEADRTADQVVAAPEDLLIERSAPHIQRSVGHSTGEDVAVPTSVDAVLASPGSPLDPAMKQDMELRLGHDFSRVRVHSGAAAEQSARDVKANAYAVGHNIVFGAGRYSPRTLEGRRLIAHELLMWCSSRHLERVLVNA